MMKLVSVKLDGSVFKETESILTKSSKSRNAYINEAVDFYNKLQKRKSLKHLLQKESKRVSESSMEVLEAFEKLKDTLA